MSALETARERWSRMTGAEYAAYLESLADDPANASRFTVTRADGTIPGELSAADRAHRDEAYRKARADNRQAEWDDHVSDWLDVEQPQSRNRVQAADTFAGVLTAREWRIKGVQPLAAEVCVMYGDSGSGKSFLVDDMAAAIHLGRPWNGKPVKQGRVIKLVAEGAGDHKYRLHAQAEAFDVELADLPPVIDNAPDIFDNKQAAEVAKQIIAAGGCDVLVIDTLSATFTGDENGSDMGGYVRNVKFLQKTLGCTVWIVHHTGKDQARGARGWSGLRAAADVELEVTRDDDTRGVRVSKQKGGTDGAQFGFKLDFVPLGRDADGEQYGSCRVAYVDELPSGKKSPTQLRGNQKLAIDALMKLAPMGERVEIAEVLDEALDRKGVDTGSSKFSDERRNIKRALETLQEHKQCVIDGAYVSRSQVVKGAPGEAF